MQDKTSNRQGRVRINVCKTNVLLILKGRAFDDKNIGNFTCRNASVVDYTIIQYRQMQWLSRFKVDEFCPLFSDVHCPSLIHIESFNDNAILPPSLSEEKIKHWSNDKKGEFLDSIDDDKVQAILIDLDGNIDKPRINSSMSDLEHIHLDAEKVSLGTPNIRKQKHPIRLGLITNIKLPEIYSIMIGNDTPVQQIEML